MIYIDRCYCFQETFASIKRVAEDAGSTCISDLQEHIEFGKNCQLCHPYVERMLETGETVFHEIISESAKTD